jgi:hypothetical protein
VTDVIRRIFVVFLVLSVPAAASAQSPWQTGIMAGTVLHREPRSTAGLDASAIIRRQQTPLVEVIAAVGALWFPETRTEFQAFNPDGTTFTEIQTQETAGPYAMLHAGRRVGRGTTDVLLVASAGVGLMREHFMFSTEGAAPVFTRNDEVVDWEISPELGVGAWLGFPSPGFVRLRPQLDVRFRTLLLVGDGFVPALSVRLGAILP